MQNVEQHILLNCNTNAHVDCCTGQQVCRAPSKGHRRHVIFKNLDKENHELLKSDIQNHCQRITCQELGNSAYAFDFKRA